MISKKILMLFFILLVAIVGCNNNEAGSKDTAAIVNGEEISIAELDRTFNKIKPMYAAQGIDLENEENIDTMNQVKESVLNQLINTTLIIQAADEQGYAPSEAEVNDSLEQIKGQYETEEQFKVALEENNLSVEILKQDIEDELKMKKYITENTEEVSITDAELKTTYDQYKEQNEQVPPFNEVKDQIRAELTNQKHQQQVGKLVEELRNNSEIEILT